MGTYGLFLKLLPVILQLFTWHLGSVQKVPVLILVLGKKIIKDVSDLPAHAFYILNHLLKFIRALASSFVNSSLSTESQTKLLKDLKP